MIQKSKEFIPCEGMWNIFGEEEAGKEEEKREETAS